MAVLTTERAMLRRMHDAHEAALEYNRKPQAFWLTYTEAEQLRQQTNHVVAGGPLSWAVPPLHSVLVGAESATGRKTFGAAERIATYMGIPVYRTDAQFIPQPSKAPDGDAIAV